MHALAGKGVGRYGTAGLSDVTISSNGYVAPIASRQGLLTLEYHSPKWDWYGNGGIEYDGQTEFLNSKGVPSIGYGALALNNTGCGVETLPSTSYGAGFDPGSPGQLHWRHQGHLGRHPRLLVQALQRSQGQTAIRPAVFLRDQDRVGGNRHQALPVPVNNSPTALDNMFFTSFRYYLP